MKLRKAHFHRFCQHVSKDIEFQPGMIAILGENGSGKSNILNGLYFAFTGDHRRNAGNKDENINWDDPGASYVSVEFEHRDRLYYLKRAIGGTDTELRTSDQESVHFTGDRAVTAAVMELLGIDDPRMFELIFVEQGHMFDFVDDTDSVRATSFSRLFQLEELTALEKLLREAGKGLVPEDHTAELKEHTESWLSSLLRAEAIRRQMGQFISATNEGDRLLVSRYQQESAAVAKYEQWRTELKEAETALAKAEAAVDSLQTKFAALLEEESHWQEEKRVAEADVELHASRKTLTDDKIQAAALHAEDSQKLATLAVPAKPSNPKTMVELSAERGQLEAKIDALNKRIDAMNGDSGECPICNSWVQGLDVDHWIQERDTLEQTLATLNKDVEKRSVYDKAMTRYESERTRLRTWVQSHATALARAEKALAAIATPTLKAADAEQLVIRSRKMLEQISVAKQAIADAKTVQRDRASDVATLSRYAREPVSRTVSASAAEAASQRLQSGESASRRYSELSQQRASWLVKARLNSTQRRTVAKQQEAAERRNAWLLHLEALEGMVHELIRMVSRDCLARLESAINPTLADLESGFEIQAGDGLQFNVVHSTGKTHRASRLSYGQKVGLGLGYHFAVNSLYTQGLGFLALDEPTVWLDRRKVRALVPAFERFHRVVGQAGLQCIIVTHEASLAPLFDQVIVLEDPPK